MRLLVLGGWGQLGADLALAAEGRHELIRPTRAEVDVTDAAAVAGSVKRVGPGVVVNLAAFHKLDECERDPRSAFSVNAIGAWNAARASRGAGARTVYVSTDYVFEGERDQGYEEDAPTRPVNFYGVSKEAGEHLTLSAAPDALIVRGSGLFGYAGSSGKGGNFVETMLAKAAAGEAISMVDDLRFSPTSTRDMAERIILLLEREAAPGVYHAANAGGCSWFEFADAIFELAGVDADLRPRSSRTDAIRRPRTSILLDTRFAEAGLPPARPWRDALGQYLGDREQVPAERRRARLRSSPIRP